MKRMFVFALFLISCISANAQIESTILKLESDNTYSFEKVFDAAGKTKDQIYQSLKSWVIKSLKTQTNTTFFDDKDKNGISTVANFPSSGGSYIEFKLNIDIKENKYRVSANAFVLHTFELVKKLGDYSGTGLSKKDQRDIMSDLDNSFSDMLQSMQSSLSKSSDW